MLLNKANLGAIFITLRAEFQKGFKGEPSNWEKVAMVVPSTSSANDYSWLSRFPKMKEWVGEKAVKSLSAFKYQIANKNFSATVAVKRDDIEDDNMIGYAQQAQGVGQSAAELPADLVLELLSDGFTNLCFDGQPFYDTDHLVAGKSVSNKSTKRLSADSFEAAQASYGAARAAMRAFKDEEGASLKVAPDLLVVPPALEDTANYLMTADRFPDNTPNIYKGTATVLVCPELKTDTEWHLIDSSNLTKPIIFQERKKAMFVSQTDLNSDDVFMRGEYKFGAEARCNVGYGFWQLAYGSTGVN